MARIKILAALWGTCCLLGSQVHAEEPLAPASERFATPESDEVPDFQRHVIPLLGKIGCNGRACHGSFQGQGGFMLSLFGYDFDADHKGLLDRIDLEHPESSYALDKPTLTIPHEGGRKLEHGTWQYHLLLAWIAGGGQNRPRNAADLDRLEVSPASIEFRSTGETQPLSVTAVWSDGTCEDVTCLCRFQSNDGSIAEVDEQGVVTCGEPGDTYVVVYYDNGVTPVQVLHPVSELLGERYPAVETPTRIDELVVDKLRRLGIVPSEVCDDAEFLRRVTLDITGTLPSSQEVRAFLADTSPDKRARKIDELLDTPAYAAWWATQLADVTGNNPTQLNNVTPVNGRPAQDWYAWLRDRVARNVPYDELVEGIVVARSRLPDESYEEFCERESRRYHRESSGSYADSPGLTYYWARTNFRTAEDRAVGFAYTFMGIRIQCAQCHKHPFDVWTQQDFRQFQNFFNRVTYSQTGGDRQAYNQMIADLELEGRRGNDLRRDLANLLREDKVVPFPELIVTGPRAGRNNQPVRARLLGGETYDLSRVSDPRTLLMDWLRNDEQRLFAKAFVNRTWASYFGIGIVNPTDDLSLANPPSHPGLLDYLSDGFIASGYDMKWLHREICNSQTYQRSWRPNDTNLLDERNFSRAIPRRLPAEVAVDAIAMATSNSERCSTFQTNLRERAIVVTETRNNPLGYALTVFGRSTRESNCDCDRSAEANLLQTVYTRNDNTVLTAIERPEGWVAEITAARGGDARRALQQQIAQVERRLRRAREAQDEELIVTSERRLGVLQQQLADLTTEEDTSAAGPDLTQWIEEAYLRTLSRFPNEDERQIALTFLNESSDPATGLRGLLWALINTKEFIVNH